MDSARLFRGEAPAIILFAHGNAVEKASEEVRELVRKMQDAGSRSRVRAAFPGLGQPELGLVISQAAGMASLFLSRIREVTEEVKVSP